VTVYPWREPPELLARTINRVPIFLQAHQPMRAAAQEKRADDRSGRDQTAAPQVQGNLLRTSALD